MSKIEWLLNERHKKLLKIRASTMKKKAGIDKEEKRQFDKVTQWYQKEVGTLVLKAAAPESRWMIYARLPGAHPDEALLPEPVPFLVMQTKLSELIGELSKGGKLDMGCQNDRLHVKVFRPNKPVHYIILWAEEVKDA